MNAKNINDVLDALAARLSVPASHLWAVLLRQAAVEFWTTVAIALALGAVFAFCFRNHLREAAKKQICNDAEFVWGVVSILTGVGACVVLLIAIGSIGNIINPEYYALHEVLGALK